MNSPCTDAINPLASVIDITKAREVLGYEPAISWRDMLAGQKS